MTNVTGEESFHQTCGGQIEDPRGLHPLESRRSRTSGLGQARKPHPERRSRKARTPGMAGICAPGDSPTLGVCRIGWVRQVKAKQGLLTLRYAVTLEEAKAQFQKSWDAWKAWAKLEEVP